MDQKMTRRQALKTGAAIAAAAPLATLPIAASAEAETMTITPDDAQPPSRYWPNDPEPVGGIPWIWNNDPWEDYFQDRTGPSIMYMIAEQAVIRLNQPLKSGFYDILARKRALAEQHLPADALEQYIAYDILLDILECPMIDFIIDVCARVLPHVDVRNGTFEEVLQAAFAAGGIPDIDAANALVRGVIAQPYSNAILKRVRACFPDFEPDDMSILDARQGFIDRGQRA